MLVGTTSPSLADPFAFDGVAPDSHLQVNFRNASAYTWAVEVPAGVKSFTLPRLEGRLKDAVGAPTDCVYSTYGMYDPVQRSYLRTAQGKSFTLK